MIILALLLLSLIFGIGRYIGSVYETEEYYRNVYPFPYKSILDCIMKTISYSWISLFPILGIAAGLYIYYRYKEKYLFKWSFKGLK